MALSAKKINIAFIVATVLFTSVAVFGVGESVRGAICSSGTTGNSTQKYYDDATTEIPDSGDCDSIKCKDGFKGSSEQKTPIGNGDAGNPFKCPVCDQETAFCNPLQSNTFEDLLNSIIRYLGIIGGSLVVIIVVWGGIQYIIAGESPDKRTKAFNTIKWGLIGFGIVLLAGALISVVRLVL